ncbi:hypothetical protein BC938DRAFT_478836 [Jimgerdemannia flammicorona]|uniref:Uncharacterized protein n=1 Tax=Jimgerdemannia flammicorona TaxID=994334 RepID=A0A433QM75_9FUNG|nr:hypothetical protein BC938DRAFT_478836 [Jimgerdemannia flammicorona]
MNANFRWPVSIPDGQKKWILAALGDEDADNYYGLMARNLIFFYKQKDAHAFDHKFDKYLLVDKEQVIRFDDEEDSTVFFNKVEGSAPICMPVDESRMMKTKPARTSERPSGGPSGSRDEAGVRKIFAMRSKTVDEWLTYTQVMVTGTPNTILPYEVTRRLSDEGFHGPAIESNRYGYQSHIHIAEMPSEVTLGDETGYLDKWVTINHLQIWENRPDKFVDCSLIGCDILSQTLTIFRRRSGRISSSAHSKIS